MEADRRKFLKILVAAPIVFAAGTKLRWLEPLSIADAHGADAWAQAAAGSKKQFELTPECDDGEDPTPSQTEGPFFTPSSPLRSSLREKGLGGVPIVVQGRVFSRNCRPIAGALIDVWHADHQGDYDNEGFRCRGHLFTDAEGRYRFESIVPGVYPGRTRHFHVKVQPRGGRVLTTQLYFPDESRNLRDGIFRPELLMDVKDGAKAKQAAFHFVLNAD